MLNLVVDPVTQPQPQLSWLQFSCNGLQKRPSFELQIQVWSTFQLPRGTYLGKK
ncbi:hypothetical protein Hanom_Chr12g01113121 [Helianthus anomalus]